MAQRSSLVVSTPIVIAVGLFPRVLDSDTSSLPLPGPLPCLLSIWATSFSSKVGDQAHSPEILDGGGFPLICFKAAPRRDYNTVTVYS